MFSNSIGGKELGERGENRRERDQRGNRHGKVKEESFPLIVSASNFFLFG